MKIKLAFLLIWSGVMAMAQTYLYDEDPKVANYDEAKIPPYVLPDLMGKAMDAFSWMNFRRPEILQQFKDIMYGEVPPRSDTVSYELLSEKNDALDNTAIRREIRIHFGMNNGKKHFMDMLIYIPKNVKGKVPTFIGLTFGGNHITTLEDDVRITGENGPLSDDYKIRGKNERRWIFPEIIKRGYASAVLSYNDIFPDRIDGWKDSIFKLFFSESELENGLKNYSAIGAWAWGLSQMADCLETMSEIDATKFAVHGHSRLGKTSLWAGVLDERFKLVCVNDSGCGGAAISRRIYGETLLSMCEYRNIGLYWFVPELLKYVKNVRQLPIDQHMLLALVAPRILAVHSATQDQWADPKGEYLSCFYAQKVYELFGLKAQLEINPPLPDQPVGSGISYLNRTGGHDQILADWEHYWDLADKYLK